MPPSRVVLVHGLWHGGWAWDPVRLRLDAAGVASLAVELPMTTLADDVRAVRHALDEIESPVVLVGHSYGGAVITAAGAHPAVRRLVYLAGFQLDTGETITHAVPEAAIAPTRLGDAMRVSDDGRHVSIDGDLARDVLYHQADPPDVDATVARLCPVARALFGASPDPIAWHSVPATYAVCTEDRAVAPDLQRAMARRSGTTLEWASDHSPMLSHPDLVASLLVSAARADC